MKISAIVMASGQSKRMGENKLFLDFKGKELFVHTMDLLKDLDLDETIIVSSFDHVLDVAKDYGFKALFNNNPEVGKSTTIRLGTDAAKADNALMYFVADQPLLTLETCRKLIEAFDENQIITYPVINDRRGAPVIFPASYREGLMNLEADQGGMILAYGQENNRVDIDDEKELIDIDTIEAYNKIKEDYE